MSYNAKFHNCLVGNSRDSPLPCHVFKRLTCELISCPSETDETDEPWVSSYMFDEPSSYLDIKQRLRAAEEVVADKTRHYTYPAMTKTLGSFKLTGETGSFTDSEIIVMLGENGTGKTTFVRLLAGDMPDEETDKQTLSVSLKPQTISPKFPGSVRMLLIKQIKAAFMHPQFQTDVLKPMSLENIMDQEVKTLSGGELQRVAIVLALGETNVNIYLLDEPS